MAAPPTKTSVRFDAFQRRYYGEIFGRHGELLHRTPTIFASENEVYQAAKRWLAEHKKATVGK